MLPLSQYFSSKQSFWYTFPASPLPSEQRSTEFILLLYMALFPLSFLLLQSSSIGPTDYLTSPASDVFEENSFLVLTPLTTCSSEPFLACLIVFNTYLLKLFSFFLLFFFLFSSLEQNFNLKVRILTFNNVLHLIVNFLLLKTHRFCGGKELVFPEVVVIVSIYLLNP